jgi:hypothetical protein
LCSHPGRAFPSILRPKTENSLTSLAAVTPNEKKRSHIQFKQKKPGQRCRCCVVCCYTMHACMRDAIPLRHANLFEKTEDHRKGWAWTGKAEVAGQTK